jgi:hypothetical protein
MALSINEANTVSDKYYDKTLTQQIYEKSPLYAKLKAKGNVSTDGGVQIQWPIRYKKRETSGFVGARQQITYSQEETRTGAVLDWKYLINQQMISWDETVQNSGTPMIVNLIKDKTTELQEDMYDEWATALYKSSPGSNDFSSLHVIIDSGTTYAGIAVADAASWAATEDTSQTELVLYGNNSLSEQMNAATFGPSKPDLHITTRDLWSKFESLIEPQKRFYGNKGSSQLAKAGFTTLFWHDGEVVSDFHCTASHWWGIDTSKFKIVYHPKFNMKTSKWQALEQAGYPYAMVKTCAWVGNLKCTMRKTSFKFTALDYTI